MERIYERWLRRRIAQALIPSPAANNSAAAGSGTADGGRAPWTDDGLTIAEAAPASVRVARAIANAILRMIFPSLE